MQDKITGIEVDGIVRRVDVDGLLATVVLEGEIDIATVPPLRDALSSCVDAGCKEITVEMGAVTFLDSAGLASLAKTFIGLGPGGVVTVSNPSNTVRRLLDLSGMSKVLTVVPRGTLDPNTM